MIKLLQLPPCPSCGLCGLAWADHFSQLLSQICLPSLSIFLLFGLPFERETDVTKSEIQRPPHRSADIEEEDFISSGARPRPFSEDKFLLLPTSQLKPVKQPEISLRYLPPSASSVFLASPIFHKINVFCFFQVMRPHLPLYLSSLSPSLCLSPSLV